MALRPSLLLTVYMNTLYFKGGCCSIKASLGKYAPEKATHQ